jgi:hypothetical protein
MNGKEYIYFLTNASLVLRVMEYLQERSHLGVEFVTTIHQIDGWIVKVKLATTPNAHQDGDLQAFLIELGTPYQADTKMTMALWSLEIGASPLEEKKDIDVFRHQFTKGLGYCPETLA